MLDRAPLTRRRLLQTTGALLAASWPLGSAKAFASAAPAAPVSDLMERLSTYMAGAAARPLPEPVVEKTKQMVLDTFAAMISGSALPPGRFAIRFARASGGVPSPDGPARRASGGARRTRDRRGLALVVGSNLLCRPIDAALANGMLAHADETDDTHPPSQSHPGCAVVPAALAVGERFGIDGARLLRSVALGYDVGPRVTATLGRLQYMVDSHRSTHSIAGTFGAAAAAGCAAGLDARQMRFLLSYAAQQASGLASWQRDSEHIEKAFDFGGMPARNGATAALLVQAGATGVDDVLSGADHFFQAFVPRNEASMLVDGLGDRYEIMRTNVKKWTVGAPIQAPLDALEALMRREGFQADAVREVVVRVATNEAKIVDNREIPDISLQHLIAVMLVDGTVTFTSAHDAARMRDPAVLRERAKVRLVGDEALERAMPRREGIVEVTLADGRSVREHVAAVRGTAENPMTRDEIAAKARDLVAPLMGERRCRRLIDAVFALETMHDIRALRPLLQRG